MSDPVFNLQVDSLGKDFNEGGGEALHVLKNVDLSLTSGESVAIIGSSGSGKTTLLNLMGGLDAPTSGQVLLNGQNLNTVGEKLRCTIRNTHLGFIYQFHHLLPEFTALENVAMPMLIKGTGVAVATEKSNQILAEVGLASRLHHKPGELSGGERQRAAIARALINDPDCILADEPTGNLDKKNAKQVMELILDLNKKHKTTLVIVTHDMHIAEKMDRIFNLEDGLLQLQ